MRHGRARLRPSRGTLEERLVVWWGAESSEWKAWSRELRETLVKNLGTVDQRNELELTITEESSTPRLIRELSMLMYYILVMMKTLYRCRYAGVNKGFAGRRQFVREWDPRFVGLLRNVLSCRRKDDVPTQITETVIDDIMTDVNVLRMEDEQVEACFIGESTGIASCIRV